MTHVLRPSRLVLAALAALALLVALALAATPLAASASGAEATAAKLKKCKPGANSKKCRCPSGKKRVKVGKKYRCKKKPARNNNTGGQQQGGNTNTGGGNTNTGGPGTNEPPPQTPQVQPVRDDAAFAAALNSTMLRRYEEGSYGYGRYAYNFLPGGQFLFCSYYYANSTVESNRAGTWEVVEGYTAPGYPGYTIGVVRIVGSDFDVKIGVEMLDNRSNVASGNASNVFTQGAFTRFIGGATTNCSSIT
jgi:hypothetical protein